MPQGAMDFLYFDVQTQVRGGWSFDVRVLRAGCSAFKLHEFSVQVQAGDVSPWP